MLLKNLAIFGASLVQAVPVPSLMDAAQEMAKQAVWLDLTPDSQDKQDPAQQMLVEILEKSPVSETKMNVAVLADFDDINDHTTAHIVTVLPDKSPSALAEGVSLFLLTDLAGFHKSVMENKGGAAGAVSVDEIEAPKVEA